MLAMVSESLPTQYAQYINIENMPAKPLRSCHVMLVRVIWNTLWGKLKTALSSDFIHCCFCFVFFEVAHTTCSSERSDAEENIPYGVIASRILSVLCF